MAEGSPAEVAVELYNRLVHLPPSEVAAIGQIEWRLRTLRQRRPSDARVGVALLQTLLLLGRAEDATRLSEQLWPARFAYEPQVSRTFASALAQLGQYERALALALPKGKVDGPLAREAELFAVSASAWGLGDLPLTRAALNAGEVEHLRNAWISALDRLEARGIAPLFQGRQRIVREALSGRQCLMEIVPTPNEEGQIELVQYSYISGDRKERAKIEEAILLNLGDYYRANGYDADSDFGLLHIVLSDVTAGPPQRDHDHLRDAA